MPLQEKKILKAEEIKTLFCNIAEILLAHKKFVEELSVRMKDFDVENTVLGDLFQKWVNRKKRRQFN